MKMVNIYRKNGEVAKVHETDAASAVSRHPGDWSLKPWPATPDGADGEASNRETIARATQLGADKNVEKQGGPPTPDKAADNGASGQVGDDRGKPRK